jgi:chromosome segregation ATPase
MSEPLTADWENVGGTLYLGPQGSAWATFPGLPGDAQKIAEAHNAALAVLRQRAETAEAEVADLRRLAGVAKAELDEVRAEFPLLREGMEASIRERAALRTEVEAARGLADAVEQYHDMARAVEADHTRLDELAVAAYQLGQCLAAYRKAQKEGS